MKTFYEGLAAGLKVPPGERDVVIFDKSLPGFYIRKFASGHTSYGVKYVVRGKQRRLSLGAVVDGNLQRMRIMASEILARGRMGIDTNAEREAALVKAQAESQQRRDGVPGKRVCVICEKPFSPGLRNRKQQICWSKLCGEIDALMRRLVSHDSRSQNARAVNIKRIRLSYEERRDKARAARNRKESEQRLIETLLGAAKLASVMEGTGNDSGNE